MQYHGFFKNLPPLKRNTQSAPNKETIPKDGLQFKQLRTTEHNKTVVDGIQNRAS